jgi:hypothetical protein
LKTDLFFHKKEIPEEIHAFLEEGLEVNYTEVKGDKGPTAIISSTVEKFQKEVFNGEYTTIDPEKILLPETIQSIRTTINQNGAILIPGILE